ncbi:MAG: RNA polymerase sigma factor [Acidobacteria bacterium]|nr:RNA polymerase sigma factor [Acidobacteriota bacterium]
MKIQLDQTSDAELLRLMLAGKRAAFAQLYQRWQAPVYRFALRLSGSVELAEDVTQDVFLTLMRDGAQYSGSGSFAAYLLTIARHSVLRRLQRERRFVTLETNGESEDTPLPDGLPDDAVDEAGPLANLTRSEMTEAVRQAVQGLPLHYREVVLLCHMQELSYTEAAEVIGCEIGTVCSRLYRARVLLAKSLAGWKPEAAAAPIKLKPARYAI